MTAKKAGATGELYIYDIIGDSIFGGVSDKEVIAKLDELRGVQSLNIRINSEGGSVFQAKGIYNAIRRFPAEKTVFIDGLAASAASFIAMAADPGKLITAENATWMIHEAHGGAFGGAADMERMAGLLRDETSSIAAIYAARTGHSLDQIRAWMAAETWMTAAEALSMKFTDQIDNNSSANNEAELSAAAKVPAFLLAMQTQEYIRAARANRDALISMEQSIMKDRSRASPGRNGTQRPAART